MKKQIVYLLITGLYFNTHLYSDTLKKQNDFRIVVGDKVNVRSDSSFNSNVLLQLRIGKMVKYINGSSRKDVMGDIRGEWIYIDTLYIPVGSNTTAKGWILDYYIADYSDFKRVNAFIECVFDKNIGETILYYEFYKNGKYKRKDNNAEGKAIYRDGSVYRHRDVIITKDDGVECYDYFFISGNQICNTHRDLMGDVVCSSCEQ